MLNKPTFFSYFRGGNLVGIGAERAGYRDIGGVEFSADIAAVCDRNFSDAPTTVTDVCAVDPALLLSEAPTVFHASPSCKNASQANQPDEDEDGNKTRETEGDRDAGRAVARFIAHWQPPCVTIENVWGYRNFDAFGIICQALKDCGYSYEYWHLNSADYGVPQTRKRLILIARHGLWRIQRPHPTHRKGGDMFHAAWRGWYEAIEDLIPTLPASAFAPWQLARLGEMSESFLMRGDNTQQEWGEGTPSAFAPAYSVAANNKAPRAFIIGDQAAGAGIGDLYADASAPVFTLTTRSEGGTQPRAFIVEGQTGSQGTYLNVVCADSPIWTISATADHRPARALLVHPTDIRTMPVRDGAEPAFTIMSGGNATHRPDIRPRAWLSTGRVVKMTTQALGRFQTVPDSYIGLTPEVNGNGVPCELARAIMESLL